MTCLVACLLVGAVFLHLGYRLGHQVGFEEGLTSAARLCDHDRQDSGAELFGEVRPASEEE